MRLRAVATQTTLFPITAFIVRLKVRRQRLLGVPWPEPNQRPLVIYVIGRASDRDAKHDGNFFSRFGHTEELYKHPHVDIYRI